MAYSINYDSGSGSLSLTHSLTLLLTLTLSLCYSLSLFPSLFSFPSRPCGSVPKYIFLHHPIVMAAPVGFHCCVFLVKNSISVYLSVCLSVSLPLCLSVCLSSALIKHVAGQTAEKLKCGTIVVLTVKQHQWTSWSNAEIQ